MEEERRARKQLEESRDAKSREIEGSWKAVLDEKKDNWEAKERGLVDKLENQERLLTELKASFEVAQRLGHNKDDQEENYQASVSSAELEIVSSELERTSHRLAEVEARNEQLRLELAKASSSVPRSVSVEEEPTFVRLRTENGSLLRKLDSARFEKDSESRRWEARMRTLEREIQTSQNDKEELRKRVQQWQDYPELKRELEVFKVRMKSSGTI